MTGMSIFEKTRIAPSSLPNMIVILLDALSARNLDLYGYSRKTAPNISGFAGKANVYHAHHAASNSTSPSTASFLTGTNPWTHRCFFALPVKAMEARNIFRAVQGSHYTAAFTQNLLADLILHEFGDALDFHLALDSFSEMSSTASSAANHSFPNDGLLANLSSSSFYFAKKNKPGSIFLSIFDKLAVEGLYKNRRDNYRQAYPYDLPYSWLNAMYFEQSRVYDGIMTDFIPGLSSPFIAYIHLWSPHEPYRPGRKYAGSFEDGWAPVEKPLSFFGNRANSADRLNHWRQLYDENIAHVDAEFGRLIGHFEKTGILDNSYVILTSDHGDLFERGVQGHVTPLMYEPLLHIPLVISTPGQKTRQDVYSLTSNVDMFPTLASLCGHPTPAWCEGQVLPLLGGKDDPDRSIYALHAKDNPNHMPIRKATAVAIKERYKLIYYIGYPRLEDRYEFYDLVDDPEELNNLYDRSSDLIQSMQADLEQKLKTADQPYHDS